MPLGFSLPFFEVYAKRTRQALFVARWIARQSGATTVGLEDMLLGLIYEDQGGMEEALIKLSYPESVPRSLRLQRHKPFFSSETAAELIRKTERATVPSQPFPLAAESPMSSELKLALEVAVDLMRGHKRSQVLPLHVLAAVLAQPSTSAAGVLRQAGFTHDTVNQAIAGGMDKA